MGAVMAAVITAAGGSTRMGGGLKKEYRPVAPNEESVLSRSLRRFVETGLFSAIVITHPAGGEEAARESLAPDLRSAAIFCPGSGTRRASVHSGLLALQPFNPDIVLIHDAARPFLSAELIRRVAQATLGRGAAVPAVPTVDTLKEVEPDGRVARHLPRERVMAAQTPQGFAYAGILRAHAAAEKACATQEGREYTDDAEMWGAFEGAVYAVPGEVGNRKITFPSDLIEAANHG
jgi:2-C-methyl-D-erythritol 4-phosphate cytidylyltransferase/2-C-methyl-D-erythritol 4-phosphate cytidylyltransferase/2-C-methyl-D-erythritol 2,4-cyclodiphosphate synthase